MDAPDTKSLPENAYLPLAPGEVYRPIVPAAVDTEEATVRSVGWGLFLCVVFTIASAYSGLKVGQVMEASRRRPGMRGWCWPHPRRRS